ncbi:MAG TPA: GtrA family protein [Acidimicrobiia bacterium]|nr:GtrA family protein [Acidimicrobiia bacterium]
MLATLTNSARAVRRRHGAKLARFGAVSAFNVVVGQILLFSAQTALGWSPLVSNTFSVSVGAVPAYFLSRYWVWERRGRNKLMREVVPFWTLALIGFAISSLAVWQVSSRWDPGPLVINLTNLAAFGVVWVSKFLILDRVLFKGEETPR